MGAPDKPQTHEVPKSMWERAKAKPLTATAIVLSFLVPLLVGSWLLLESGGGFSSFPGREDAGVEGSRGAEIPDESDDATDSADPQSDESSSDEADTSASNGSASAATQAPVIAYRKEGVLYVSNDDGSEPQEIATSERGAFALSPDGATLAWVDGASGMLHLSRVGGGDIEVTRTEDIAPAWAPDSKWLAYTASSDVGSEVFKILADGSGRQKISQGHTPRISGDGQTIALIASDVPGVPGDVNVESAAGASLGSIAGAMAIEAVPVGDRVVYAVGGEQDAEEIRIAAYDGSNPETLVGAAKIGVPVVFADLIASPDGKLLQYAATGDDHYSRTFVVELTGEPTPFALSIRRDTYPLRWGSGDARLFIVEGNAFQGEKTTIIGVGADGLGRAVVVEGGGL